MRKVGFLLLILALVLVMIATGCGKTHKLNRMMVGTWASPEREYTTNPDGSVYYIIQEYIFTDNAFRLTKTVYGDPVSNIKFYTETIDGTYELTKESKVVEGASDIELTFTTITLAPNSLAFVNIFNQAKCGNDIWGLDNAQDISETGCLSTRSIKDYPKEYNIVAIIKGSLYFGMRPRDGDLGNPDNRPIKLSPGQFAPVKP